MRSSKSDPRPSKAIEFSDLSGKRTTDLVTSLVGLSGCAQTAFPTGQGLESDPIQAEGGVSLLLLLRHMSNKSATLSDAIGPHPSGSRP